MKPTHDPNNPSCSCTSCTYKSVSEQPSIQRFIVDGSKIDKLYIGKYIPLRERKLLDRLVRTRAVYDDIRNQLISESDASDKDKPNLKPRKNQQRPKDLRGNKSGSISELVDMVDKGNIPERTDLSECCSCCICGSKIIHTHHEHMEMRKHKHRQGRGAVDRMSLTSSMIKQKMREAKRGFAHRISRSSMMMMRQKIKDARRGVRARAKSIMSDPCTCTTQLTEEVTRRSKEVARRFRPNVQLGEQTMFEGVLSKKYSKPKPPVPLETEIIQKEHKRGKALRKSYQKIKKSKDRLIESMEEGARKVKESKTKLKKHIETEAKKSVDKIIHGKHKLNEHIKAAVKKSMQELDFPIKKDSIAKFKEKIKTRKQMQDSECQRECIRRECVPEECFKILKLRRMRKGKKHKSSMESFSETGLQARHQEEVATNEMGQEREKIAKIDRVDKRRIAMAAKYQQQKMESTKKGAVAEPRISIEIATKKKRLENKSKMVKPKVKRKGNYVESPKNTRSVESTTNVTPVSSKYVSSGPEQKQSSKKQKAKLQPSVVLKTRKRPSGRKTVKDSPSFSFSIEYRKGNEHQKQMPRQIFIQKRHRIQGARNKHEYVSQTKIFKPSRRELQTGGHALKRCFCTLKLKGKGYKSRPSRPLSISTETQSQTRKLDQSNAKEHVQTRRIKSREMACVTCLQEQCDPTECVRMMKNRHRRVGTNNDTKSISSVTSGSRSASSKTTTADAPQKLKKIVQKVQPSSDNIEKSHYESGQGEQKQAVRISSSFSFSVEFYKDKPAGDVKNSHEERTEKVKRQNAGTHRRRHLRHKHSQISSLTGKSKYTLTSHSLKRCFCTLKLGQTYNKKTKPIFKSTGSNTSQQYTPDMNHDIVSVHKGVATDKQINYRLLPYECEPGICIPGECDPYVCLELINKRQVKFSNKYCECEPYMNHRNAKKVITDYPETKSMSSFTSRPNKVKTVQSTTDTIVRKHRNKEKTVRQVKTTPSSPNRQVVRISSSFSFNIEFHKDTSPVPNAIDVPLERPSQVSETAKRRRSKERGNQDKKIKKHQKSTSMLVKKKNRGSFIAPMKRCFCTLKLQTADLKENATIGTETPIKNAVDYKNVLVTKGTKTKYGYTLEPYECEPGVCVPGQCDPYECLQRIQMRQLKESGTGTDKAKMKSATSVTQKGKFRSKSALAQSKLRGQQVSTILQKVKKIPDYYTAAENQAVRIGSNFSFNIEFYKDKKQSSVVNVDNPSEISNNNMKPVKKLKHRGVKIRGTSRSHQDTQASISQVDRAAGIRPMLKRCFCTLKLQGNQNKKLKTNIMAPNVIAVSRVTVTETKIKSLNNMFINELAQTDDCANDYWATALYDFQSSTGTLSKSSIVFRYKEMQSYFRKSSLQSMRSNKLTNNILKTSHRNVLARSNSILPNYYAKVDEKYSFSENCTISCQSKLCLKRRKSLLKYKRAYINSQSSIISEPLMNYPSFNKLRKQNYYTMNIQIPEKKNKYKLKPYECEPGICIPDHCDPYECQKLIMKRLMKKVSRMSGTNMTSKSMGSSTNQSTSSSKRLQSKQQRGKAKKVAARSGGMTFKTIPSHKKHKQAVRVGSNFSFNIEFSKDRSAPPAQVYVSPPPTKIRPTKPIRKKIKEQGTRGRGMNYHDQDSQSGTETANKGSSMKPMMQRCFCTLKLQKKGKHQRQERVAQKASDRGTGTPPNTLQDFIASRTMANTGQNTAAQKPLKLLPYECEPLVCVPGECDPYECLERIKKRNMKNIGTGAIQYNTSTGSMTGKKQYRTQKKQIQSKNKNRQTKSRGSTETRSSKIESYQIRPSKQAVRIGSSFSFNVEFFKENDQAQLITVPREPQPRPIVVKERVPKATVNKIRKTDKGLQDAKGVHHRDSQIENMATHGKSTMTTSFMKRCFCTANLHKKTQQVPLQNKGSQSKGKNKFVKRFSSAMQKVKGKKSPKLPVEYANSQTETISEPTHKDKKVVTRHYKELRQQLLPYECEPGICVPGECDPYECDKLIKARNMKLQTREVITDRPRTRSTSSNFSSQTSKARRTQSNFKKTSSTTKPRPSKIVRETEPVPRVASNRQVVRIGSTFSFNVEFYKDRTPNTEEVQAAAKAVRHKPSKPRTKVAKTGFAGEKTRNTGSMGASATIDQESQANRKMHDRGSGFGSALKRCFCTLKLQQPKKPVYKAEESQATDTLKVIPTHQTRGVGTGKHWKLKPYECEPGVCVPGQCNPYECEKRIQLRNMRQRDSGTSTRRKHRRKSVSSDARSKGKSVSSDIRSNIRSKARKNQYKQREGRRRSQSVSSRPTHSRTSLDTSTRQSVRIGSGFSFDIEFHKNKANTYAEPKIQPLRQKIKPTKSMTSSGNKSFSKTKNRKMQHHKGVRDTDSQIMAQKMRNTGVNPLLRRCFCTLKLQKSGDMASNPTIISRAARDKNVYMATLLPYECEPGVCIPGECDPYECQKRIQRRLMRSQQSGTKRSSQDSSTSSTPGARYKSTRSQSQKSKRPRQKHQKGTHAKAMREYRTSKPAPYSGSSSRQAVRIGSSFNFDVEFCKSSSEKSHTVHRESYSTPKKEPYSMPKKRVHDMKTKPKHKQTRNKSVTSSDIRLYHNQMQTGSGTESKSTGFGPSLKRCFCTLALHKKKTPPATETKFTNRNDDLSDLYQYSRNVCVGTYCKKYLNLKPYECEPGICVPGSCDPYECYERIKRRMKDICVATDCPGRKYAASSTPKNIKYKAADTQSQRPSRGPRKERRTMANFKEESRGSPGRRSPCNNARQAVRLGSNFSFSVEFYKERPSCKIPKNVRKIKTLEKEKQPKPSKSNKVHKVSSAHKKYANRQSFAGKPGSSKKSQADRVKNTSKGTGTGSFLKRCFCTLNLYNKNKQEKKNSVIKKPPEIPNENHKKSSKIHKEKITRPPKIPKEKPKKPEDINREVMVQTKERHKNKFQNYSLKPYECEPNVCIPGECDPYECLERIKRRNIRRQSRRTGTNRRASQISASSMASKRVPRTNRYVQSFERGKRYSTRPSQGPKYVEEPRFAHVFEDIRSGVKIGSNVSFNIEFYKDKSECPPMYKYPPKYKEDYRPKEIKMKYREPNRKSTISESRPKGMHIGVGDKCNRRACDAQASGVAMKDTGTGVNNVLKRCFCTLKLQKKPQKVITINRVAIDNANRMGFNPAETFKNNHLHSLKILKTNLSNNFKNILKPKNKVSFKNNQATNLSTEQKHVISKPKDKSLEMTTLYPYIPTKFNKNVSKTVLLRNKESRKINSDKIGAMFIKSHHKNLPAPNKELKVRYKTEKRMKNSETIYQERGIPHKKSWFGFRRMRNITDIFHRILPRMFFTDKKNKVHEKSIKKNLVYTTMPTNKVNFKKPIQDTLKTSKSDRQSRNIKKITSPKKTISLKVTNAPERIRLKRKKKSSRYQSVDAGQIQTTVHNCGQKSIFPGCGNVWCAYCHIINDKNGAISLYNSPKIAQMAKTRNKNNVNQTNFVHTADTNNSDTKNETHSKGLVIKDPGAIKNRLSKYIHGLENNNKIKGNGNCLTDCKGLLKKGEKNGLSSGDGTISKPPVKEGKEKTVAPKNRLSRYIHGLENNNKIKTSDDCTCDCKRLLSKGKKNGLSSGDCTIFKSPVKEGKEKIMTPKNRLRKYIHGLDNNNKIKTKKGQPSFEDDAVSKLPAKEGKEKTVTPKNRLIKYIHGLENNNKIKTNDDCLNDCKGLLGRGKTNELASEDGAVSKLPAKEGKEKTVTPKNRLIKYIHGLENNNKIKTNDDCLNDCKGLLGRGKTNGLASEDGAVSKSPAKKGKEKTVTQKNKPNKYIHDPEYNNKIKTSHDCASDCKGLLRRGKKNGLFSGDGAISKSPVKEGNEKTVTPKNRLNKYIHGLIKTSEDCTSDCKGLLRSDKKNGLPTGNGAISKSPVKTGKEKTVTPKNRQGRYINDLENKITSSKKQKKKHLSAGDAPTDDERPSDGDDFTKCTPWVQPKPKANKIEGDAKYKINTGIDKHIRKPVKPLKYTGIKLTKKGYSTGPKSTGKIDPYWINFPTSLKFGNKKSKQNPLALKLNIKAKRDPKAKGKPVSKTNTCVCSPTRCVCGSIICSVESEKMEMIKKNIDSLKPPPCICGSKPCSLEIIKKYRDKRELEEYKKNLICQCRAEIERARKRIALKKKRDLDLIKINKRFNAEDKKRMKERAKDDKRKMKDIKKYKKSDSELAAESLLDVLKLGYTASKDMLRSAARAILHPRRASANMKDMYRNPSGAVKALGSAITGSGGVPTMKRLQERFNRMSKLQRMIARLEENRFTRYIMFMISKDARKRMLNRKRRMRRRREPIEFECSLYMASLRKRPCVAVYYSCPWFYPHCLSMLNLWKQLTEIMLFIIAVTVWSPCIVLMEVCRAAMCCFLCTGG